LRLTDLRENLRWPFGGVRDVGMFQDRFFGGVVCSMMSLMLIAVAAGAMS
jgi:hypothetical protein